ncbi:MAG: hypothetical protein AAB091_00075, partial [Elusimicrobiota bacterium]
MMSAIEQGRIKKPRVSEMMLRLGVCLLAAAKLTVVIVYMKLKYAVLLRRYAGRRFKVILKSWGLQDKWIGNNDDFYFGKLTKWFENEKIGFLVLYGDRFGLHWAAPQASLLKSRYCYLPDFALTSVLYPLKTVLGQWRTAWALRRIAQEPTEGKLAIISAVVALDCLSPATTVNALYYDIAKQAARMWQPEVFMNLYEGQPLEKLMWLGVKAAHAPCVTVGYQHTVVMPYAWSLIRPNLLLDKTAIPQVVMCTGEATRKMMEPGHRPLKTEMMRFGSFRRDASQATGRK